MGVTGLGVGQIRWSGAERERERRLRAVVGDAGVLGEQWFPRRTMQWMVLRGARGEGGGMMELQTALHAAQRWAEPGSGVAVLV